MEEVKNFPTMIIPNGTDISVNENGQLSIRTPGNLVIQNSGVYSVIESGNGSVRIDPDVKVEAVSVQAADSCFVAGQLTAWRVCARTITLERGAQANIMLQESESLDLDRNARLVGNFASEKELYLMLGRFSRELRDLPNGVFAGDDVSARIPAGNADRAADETAKRGFCGTRRRERGVSNPPAGRKRSHFTGEGDSRAGNRPGRAQGRRPRAAGKAPRADSGEGPRAAAGELPVSALPGRKPDRRVGTGAERFSPKMLAEQLKWWYPAA